MEAYREAMVSPPKRFATTTLSQLYVSTLTSAIKNSKLVIDSRSFAAWRNGTPSSQPAISLGKRPAAAASSSPPPAQFVAAHPLNLSLGLLPAASCCCCLD